MRFYPNKKSTEWHRWFAWYPVSVTSQDNLNDHVVIFEWIYRKINSFGIGTKWNYKLINDLEIKNEKVNKISVGQIMAEILCQDEENLPEKDKLLYEKFQIYYYNNLSEETRKILYDSVKNYLEKQIGKESISKDEE